ncbi:MAG: acetate--CoA ligase family protein, partial [Betaproteobacteria bacterium]
PVNAARKTVQGLAAFPDVQSLPDAPDLAVVAVAGDEAMRAVEACAERGVKTCVVMASGFGETGEAGRSAQERMLETARAAGMRLIGPNCQGLANFGTGLVANFSTIFNEVEAKDGPIAIISQSGANSQAIYQLCYEKGLWARHVLATGNEADVSVADLAAAVAEDEGVKLVLLYMEAIKRPGVLAEAAATARARGIPIVALKAGRTASGQKAASSHTGALATEDRVVDAFFEQHAIWRAETPQQLVAASELYLSGRRPQGSRLVFVSNSGASCVMAADYAERNRIPLAQISAQGKERLKTVLPAFAGMDNPIDTTGVLLGNSGLFGAILPVVGEDAQSDLMLVGLPIAGAGYDVPRFARDLSEFQTRYPHAVAVAATQHEIRDEFRKQGIASFAAEGEAMDALAQLARHAELLRKPAKPFRAFPVAEETRFLNEAESLTLLREAGLPVVDFRFCRHQDEVRPAWQALAPAVMKACSRDIPHKSDVGLVSLNVDDPEAEFRRLKRKVGELNAWYEGIIVARKVDKGRELALGARLDPSFGPLVMVGDGGIYLEALKDFRLLVPPFSEEDALAKIAELRVAPLLGALRGQPARDARAFARMAVKLGEAMLAWAGKVISVDINPVVVFETGLGAVAIDGLVEVPADQRVLDPFSPRI